jgi:hypothetical protein
VTTDVCDKEHPSTGATGELILQLVPAIVRQATIKVHDSSATHATALVAAEALGALRFPAEVVSVEVTAYSHEAWEAPEHLGAGKTARRGAHDGEPHYCVTSGGVLIDACLDLCSVPGGSLSLRPSWFQLPSSWVSHGYAAFRQRQTGAVVTYRRVVRPVELVDDDESGQQVLNQRLASEVVDCCQKAQEALAGSQPAPARWVPLDN